MPGRDAAVAARAYWEQAPPSFAHITPAQATYTVGWRRQWLEPLMRNMLPRTLNPCVVDVGIGAGALGVLLLRKYGLSHYAGVDVAQRQLDRAREALVSAGFSDRGVDGEDVAAESAPHTFSLHISPVNFSLFSRCSLLVCQAVMQHFPSREYTVEWLRDADASGIAWLMLQPRWSATPIFSDWGADADNRTDNRSGVANASRFDGAWLLRHLPSYELRWASPIYPNGYIFYAFERTVREARAGGGASVASRSARGMARASMARHGRSSGSGMADRWVSPTGVRAAQKRNSGD